MKPYGLDHDRSPRPRCPCCRMKYHGRLAAEHATAAKDAARRGSRKRARQASKRECVD